MRWAGRSLWQRPGLTAAALATLALGIGVNAAVFSLIDALLLRPLPIPGIDRLAMAWENGSGIGNRPGSGLAGPLQGVVQAAGCLRPP